MTLTELHNKLLTTGYPVAYNAFPSDVPVEPPFITYAEAFTNNARGDDSVYKKIRHIEVDLWTREKDETAQETLEAVLDTIAFWDSTEVFGDNQYIYRVTYDFEII